MFRIESFCEADDKTIQKANKFISSTTFNNGISFLDYDDNYFEDFTWLYFLYENNSLVSVLSIFLPDTTSCELYFHVCDCKKHKSRDYFSFMHTYVCEELNKFEINNRYLLWNSCENTNFETFAIENIKYNHSECLMKFDLDYSISLNNIRSSHIISETENGLLIKSFYKGQNIGVCNVELSGDYALIYGVEINSSMRGLGFGRETLLTTLNFLKENHYTDILLHVNSANTAAYALYSHHGFNIIQKIDYWKLI